MDITTLYTCFNQCGKVTTDTRNCPEGSMFIALKGETFNGNAFAKQALEKGCRYAVVDEAQYADGENILLVDDCLKTLQGLANYHRRQMGTRIIGITGTNGKTTTKELIATVLQKKYKVLYTQGNLNNHIGVPLICTLVNIAEPDCGLITNVGKAHLEGFGSFEGVVKTKSELYDYLRNKKNAFIFLDKDNEVLCKASAGLEAIGYGMENDALYVSGKLHACAPFLAFEWKHEGKSCDVNTHLIGAYNVKNALAAIAIGCRFEVPAEAICEALNGYIPSNNRSQLTETESNHLIVDAYNANPTSMMAALENFRLMEVEHKVAVLGDMKELGEGSVEEHRKIVGFLGECGFEKVILVGAEFGKVNTSFEHYPDVEAVKAIFAKSKPEGKFILIKGSNSMKLAQLKDIL